jgi:hypothetical protein
MLQGLLSLQSLTTDNKIYAHPVAFATRVGIDRGEFTAERLEAKLDLPC